MANNRDPRYQIHAAGSTALGTDQSVEGVFGSFSGLSTLDDDRTVHMFIESFNGNDFRIGDTGNVSSASIGFPVFAAASGVDWPPQRAGSLSQLKAVNRVSGNQASIAWTLFTVELD